MSIHVFLRKKRRGENSMEALMESYKDYIDDLIVFELPCYSTTVKGIFTNIYFAIKNKGDYNWVYTIGDGYISIFLRKCTITVHDTDNIEGLPFLSRILVMILCIYIPSLKRNKYHCISNYTRKKLIRYIPYRKKDMHIVYNPLNPIFYSHKCSQFSEECSYPITILQIGTGVRKNLESVITSIQDKDKYRLLIVGLLSDKQKELLLKSQVYYTNYVDITTHQIVDLYNQADIVTFPSGCEGFGMIVIEANAMGVPVIAGDIEVLHEIGNEAAYYVAPGDISQMKYAIEKIHTDSQFRQQLINNGICNAKRFDIQLLSRQLACILKQF